MLFRASINSLHSRKLFFPVLKEKNFAHIFIGLLKFVSGIASLETKGIYSVLRLLKRDDVHFIRCRECC